MRPCNRSATGTVSGTREQQRRNDGGITPIQAGQRHEHYFYTGWRLIETTDHAISGDDYSYAGAAVLNQYVYGTQYIDEPLRYDRDTDDDNDCIDSEGSAAYYYHQDANWRVVMLTDEDGFVAERYRYTAYGEPEIYSGYDDQAGGELGHPMLTSRIGNPFMHQGLFRDGDTRTYQNRFRQYNPRLGRFMQRDPEEYAASMNLMEYAASSPGHYVDPRGLTVISSPIVGPGLIVEILRGGLRPPSPVKPKPQPEETPAKRPRKVRIAVDPDDEKSGDTFLKWTEYWKQLNPEYADDDVTVGRINTDKLLEAVAELDNESIDVLIILDHGSPTGAITCGEGLLGDDQIKAICDKMKAGGEIKIWSCYGGKRHDFLCGFLAACPKLSQVCGYTGKASATGPSKDDPECKPDCATPDNCP